MIERNSIDYERIDISEGIDVNKTNLSKEWDILKISALSL